MHGFLKVLQGMQGIGLRGREELEGPHQRDDESSSQAVFSHVARRAVDASTAVDAAAHWRPSLVVYT